MNSSEVHTGQSSLRESFAWHMRARLYSSIWKSRAPAAPALSYIALTSSCVCLLHRWDELHEQGPRLRPHLQRGSGKRRSVVRVPSGFWTGQKPERLYMYVSHVTAVPLTTPPLTHTHTHTHEEPTGCFQVNLLSPISMSGLFLFLHRLPRSWNPVVKHTLASHVPSSVNL